MHYTLLNEAYKEDIDDARLKDIKAKNFLFKVLDQLILETILNKDTTKSVRNSLKRKYQGTTQGQQAQWQVLQKRDWDVEYKNRRFYEWVLYSYSWQEWGLEG